MNWAKTHPGIVVLATLIALIVIGWVYWNVVVPVPPIRNVTG